MFKTWKEMRELKRMEKKYKVFFMGKIFSLVNNFPDIVELAKKAKDLNIEELQKLIAEELVNYIKANEKKPEA